MIWETKLTVPEWCLDDLQWTQVLCKAADCQRSVANQEQTEL